MALSGYQRCLGPYAKRDGEWKKRVLGCLSARRSGYFRDYWGRTQHFLLPALCAARRAEATVGLIGVLERKYAGYGEDVFTNRHLSRSGFVASPLSAGSLERISDA